MTERRAPGFKAELLDAIRAGRKTQARPIVRDVFQHTTVDGETHDCIRDWDGGPSRLDLAPDNWEMAPYGVSGDTWGLCEPIYRANRRVTDAISGQPHHAEYDDGTRVIDRRTGLQMEWKKSDGSPYRVRQLSARYMPAYACRDFVTVKRVQVERVQGISEEDAQAEGVELVRAKSDTGLFVWCYEFGGYVRDAGREMVTE